MQFGLSTHLFFKNRLTIAHLEQMRRAGFEVIEIFCSCQHFDHHDEVQVETIFSWLDKAGVTLNSIHAPYYVMTESRARAHFSLASIDEEERRRAVAETAGAIKLSKKMPFRYIVVHLGATGRQHQNDDLEQAKRSLRELIEISAKYNVQVAVENILNTLSTSDQLVRIGEEFKEIVYCLDSGHANLEGDPIKATKLLGSRIAATHLSDNHGKEDDHLPPYQGKICWSELVATLQALPYRGVYMFEIADDGEADRRLLDAADAMARFLELEQGSYSEIK